MNKVEELIQYFNNAYGMEREWPPIFEVSAELYGRCCQYVFDNSNPTVMAPGEFQVIPIAVGVVRCGLMFKNVELIIKKEAT